MMELFEYPKMKALYIRDAETKRVKKVFRNPVYGYLQNDLWYGLEKIDGTNIRIFWDGHKVTIHGRTSRSNMPKPLREKLTEMFLGDANEEIFEQVFGDSRAMLVGEGIGPKIGPGAKKEDFILFDVCVDGFWLSLENMYDVATKMGLKSAKILAQGKLQDLVEFVQSGTQCQYSGKILEGLIARPLIELYNKEGERIACKIRYVDVKELLEK